jgi:hypothetical protein
MAVDPITIARLIAKGPEIIKGILGATGVADADADRVGARND